MELIYGVLFTVGIAAGFVAGLFGIGGGVILVPLFWFFFQKIGVPQELSFKLAVATSLSVIAVSTLFSTVSHILKGSYPLKEAAKLLIFSLPGVLAGVLLAHYLPVKALKNIFGIFLVITGVKLLLSGRGSRKLRVKERVIVPLTVVLSGFLSSLLGIGGGVVVNSILFSVEGIKVERTVAIASAASFLNALLGAALYLMVPAEKVLCCQVGLVYVPGAVLVACGSLIGVKLGLRVLRGLNQHHLKKLFAVMLLVIAAKILLL
ncbi:sulfite exporter TauE/SafE family protein [Thermovibrio ammonificans]|uniref:Probable membrane transporter protein n=1 Tax=Thermovibrio ammonificans (strain DSM 15698 / JCM 12110 / HB-1) TaxID=648996 RepID=E8T365_THEA1|nr:sulfite exporter TauE/SafE family protein [Thermovibrio ammonificans]ADU96070.1 protein of unknown function DUF81 [Thermovibrio ammonificans HB-1]